MSIIHSRPSSRAFHAAAGITLLAGVVLLGQPAGVAAQVVSNPRIVEFDPSADHSATLGDGSAAVTRYDFELYLAGASSPFHVVNLGKPAPESDGKVRFDFSAQSASWPLPGGTYESRVTAVGPGGSGRSDTSNQFTFAAPCSYSLTSSSLSAGAAAGSSSIGVVAAAGCAWTATNPTAPNWVTLGTSSGTGNATVAVTFTANPSSVARSLTLTIAGVAVTVNQAGAACTYSVTPAAVNVGSAAGSGSVTVTAPAGCSWTASTSTPWLSVATASGSGTGTASFSYQYHVGTVARGGSLTIGGQTLAVTQVAISAPIAPASLRVTGVQ